MVDAAFSYFDSKSLPPTNLAKNQKYLKKAGLGGKNMSCHKLRHTSATTMFQYGKVDVRTLQVLLGHSSLNTTQIYTAVSNDQLQNAVNANPLAGMFGR